MSQVNHCFNRIHVDDIVGVVLASMARPCGPSPRVYNVVDDLPAPQVLVLELLYAWRMRPCDTMKRGPGRGG